MKKSILMAALFASAGFSGIASAHNYSGTLGSGAGATDRWYFQCLSGTNVKITYQILRTAGTPCVSTNSYSPLGASTKSCGAWSPLVTVLTGPGVKFFQVNKSPAATGTNSYVVSAHCWNSDGTHQEAEQTTPQIYLQNQ